jgi:hypothetical protein
MPSPSTLRTGRGDFSHVTQPGRKVSSSVLFPQAAGACPCENAEPLDLSLEQLHGRSVAILLRLAADSHVLRGRAEFLHDPDLGGVLRIRTHGGRQETEWLLVEGVWEGPIRSGRAVGCDYLICLQPMPASSAAVGAA